MNQLQTPIKIKPELEIEFTPQTLVDWVQWMYLKERSKNSITSYTYAIKLYIEKFNYIISKSRMIEFKKILLSSRSFKTVNLRLTSVNSFIDYLAELHENPKIYNFKIKGVKIHTRTSVENVITTEEFHTLLNYCLNSESIRDNKKWYLIVKTLGYTGVRVSELVKLQSEDLLKYGYFKVIGKGGKYRDVLVPNSLKEELITFIKERKITGNLFKPDGRITSKENLTTRGVSHYIYSKGEKAGIPKEHCHPHSFRHMYALNLLEATGKDLAFVSDMLGHSNVTTTSVYLKMSLDKQKNIINEKVNW